MKRVKKKNALNIFYSLFFLVVDFAIFAQLTKAYKIEKKHLYFIGGSVLTLWILHNEVFHASFLMPYKDFLGILMFSFCLIILHLGSKFQVAVYKNLNTTNTSNKKFPEFVLKVFDIMRFKIIYFLIYAYQFLAIWIPEIR
ncbi:MAG: hypothetical protein ACO1OF_07360 [Adhaeribacter sp.]